MTIPIYPINVFDTSFFKLPHLELATYIIGIGQAFSAHRLYQVMPEGIPNGEKITQVGTRYHDVTYAVMTGVTSKRGERDACREDAVLTTSLTLNWAGMRYLIEKNFEAISDLGVEHSKNKPQTRSATPVILGAPTNMVLEHSTNTGSLHLILHKVPGAITYIVQACQGDPNDEAAWVREWQFTKIKGGVELTGLEPGKIYYVRVRCLGHTGYGPWSDYVHIMVV